MIDYLEKAHEELARYEQESNQQVEHLEHRVEQLSRDRLAIRELLTKAQAKAAEDLGVEPTYLDRHPVGQPLGWSLEHPDGSVWFLCTDHPPDFAGWKQIDKPPRGQPRPGRSFHCGICDLDLRPRESALGPYRARRSYLAFDLDWNPVEDEPSTT